MKAFAVLAILFTLLIPALPASAVGIGISPKSISVTQREVDRGEVALTIYNTGDDPAIFLVESDVWSQLIYTSPDKFRLDPEEARVVKLVFDRIPHGEHHSFISIVAQDVGAEAGEVKTGVKIPVRLEITKLDQTYQQRFIPFLLGLILVSLALLLLAALRHQHLSRFGHFKDAVQEYYARRSWWKLLRHYFKHHALLVLSGLAILLTGALLLWSFVAPPAATLPQTNSFSPLAAKVNLEIKNPEGTQAYTLSTIDQAYSAFTALQDIAESNTISLEYDPPNELGVFVTKIGDYKNGQDGKFWVYEINETRVPIASDKYVLKDGDKLVWKFVTPQD